ncbi:hypothetical protein HPB47_014580 [Ixodes persulcatus]|uniref:Uncharacterized protein n=1 Tax=Ixodes persulcatus TaxID=34615 RepID=A0AC60QZ83_IXOPE|nr:hypothetical protein HPB47_014580 [Ixodes persulcatus]
MGQRAPFAMASEAHKAILAARRAEGRDGLANHVDLRKSLGEKAALGCSGRVVARVYGRFPDSTLRWTLNGRRLLIDRHRHLFAGGDLSVFLPNPVLQLDYLKFCGLGEIV